MEYHLKNLISKISVCHELRKSLVEWERQQLLISELDASFLGGRKHDGRVDRKVVDRNQRRRFESQRYQ